MLLREEVRHHRFASKGMELQKMGVKGAESLAPSRGGDG